MKILIISFWLILTCITNDRLYSQNMDIPKDSLNQYDDNGKKHGIWVEYLNENFRVVKKEKKAMFYRYVKYQHGVNFYQSIIPKGYFSRTYIKSKSLNDSIRKPVLLCGDYYILITKKNKIYGKCSFSEGWLVNDTAYNWNGSIGAIINFTNKYNNIDYSFFKQLFDENGKLYFQGFGILENSKWRVVRIK